MKKLIYSFFAMGLMSMSQCNQKDVILPLCDNSLSTTSNALNFDFSGCSYLFGCTQSPYDGSAGNPPEAGGASYDNGAQGFQYCISCINPTSIQSTQFLLELAVANDQVVQDQCTNPAGVNGTVYYHLVIGPRMSSVFMYKNHQSDVTANYYEPCNQCTAAISGRPHYIASQMVQPGDMPNSVMFMNSANGSAGLYRDGACQ